MPRDMSDKQDISTIGQNYDELFKILIIGDSGVGKTSILRTYTEPHSIWDSSYVSTIGVDFKVSTCIRNDKVVKLQIWDTAGQERFRAIVASYYRGAHGVILTYDINDVGSLKDVMNVWISEVDRYASPDSVLILIGNKVDLEDNNAETVEETRNLAKRLVVESKGRIIINLETSAKTGYNVETAFTSLVDKLLTNSSQVRASRFKHRASLGSSTINIPVDNKGTCSC